MRRIIFYFALILCVKSAHSQITWAGSNIYWDGSKLTFAAPNDPQVEVKRQYQGVFFKWGSLIGISPASSFKELFTRLYVPDPDTDLWYNTTANKKGWVWNDIPYVKNQENSSLKTVFRYSDYQGDICRFLSGKPGIPKGNWRLPSRTEFEPKEYFSPKVKDDFQLSNADGTTLINNYILKDDVVLPASGSLHKLSGSLIFGRQHNGYWSGSNSDSEYAYFMNFSPDAVYSSYKIEKNYALPIRCVCEQENTTLNQSQSPNGIFFNGYIKNGNDYQLLGVGSNIPDISISLLNGENIRIADLKGKIVLLSFFATWCGPCRFDFKYIKDEIWDAIKNKDFLILAIATFKDTPEKVKSNANYNNLPFPVGFDSDESSSIIRQFYGPQSTISVPYDILIGRDGKVLKAHVGYDKETLDEMKELILREL